MPFKPFYALNLKEYELEEYEYFRGDFMANSPEEDLDGNTILTTSINALVKHNLGLRSAIEQPRIHKLYMSSIKEPGLVTRGPHKFDDAQTHDDIVGFVSYAALHSPGIALVVYDRLKNNSWYYAVRKPESIRERWNNWFGRFPGVVAHIKLAAWVSYKRSGFNNVRPPIPAPGVISQLLMALDVFLTALKNDGTSGHIQDWIKAQTYELAKKYGFKSKILEWAFKYRAKNILKNYPNGMGDVFQIYYQRDPDLRQETKHIFARWMRGIP